MPICSIPSKACNCRNLRLCLHTCIGGTLQIDQDIYELTIAHIQIIDFIFWIVPSASIMKIIRLQWKCYIEFEQTFQGLMDSILALT